MKEIDYDGLLMCRIQGKIFEESSDFLHCSSAVFIKKYMLSEDARSMDVCNFLNKTKSDIQVLQDINDNEYGERKYSKDELYWIGYIYRYWCYTYNISSKKVFKLFSGRRLKDLYYVYHTHDPANAIERIIENFGLEKEDDNYIFNKTRKLIEKELNVD